MKVVFDIETDGLTDYTKIWCIVAVDVDTNTEYVWREGEYDKFLDFAKGVTKWIGHNIIDYDCKVLTTLLGMSFSKDQVVDTLVLSHLLKYRLDDGHSLEAWGDRLGIAKVGLDINFKDQSSLHSILERCKRDVEINLKLYQFLMTKLDRKEFHEAIQTEMEFAWVCRDMHENGFCFDIDGAKELYTEIEKIVEELDSQIKAAFPPRAKLVREYTPRLTKYGTISKSSVPRSWEDLTLLSADAPFSLVKFEEFNPTSTKQIIERISKYWDPVDRTDTYIKAQRNRDKEKLKKLEHTAWKVNEANLATLSSDAPVAARLLVRRLMLGARLRTLTEWMSSYNGHTGRVHGRFNGIGTWTHRMAHKEPNLGNVATEKSIKYNEPDLKAEATRLGGRMRSLWRAEPAYEETTRKFRCSTNENIILSITRSGRRTFDNSQKSTVVSKETGGSDISTEYLLTTLTEWLKSKGVAAYYVTEIAANSLSITVTQQEKLEDSFVDSVIRSLDGTKIDECLLSCISTEQKKVESYLCGTDMESAHLRIFAHLIDDEDLKKALLTGDKKNGTDPHSINAQILRDIGADRDRAKTFIFTFFNGGGVGKVSSIFGTSASKAKEALGTFIESYPGLKRFKEKDAKAWARRGYFKGPDGRLVVNDSDHHMLAGYLQNYEATMMKKANLIWRKALDARGIKYKQVNLVHDEYVTEVYADAETAWLVGLTQSAAISLVGKQYGMRIKMAGDWQVGKTWLEVH